MTFPILETERLILSEITDSDISAVFALFSNEDVVKYYDLQKLEEFAQAEKLVSLFKSRFDSETGIRWAIRLKNTNSLIGTCGFNSWVIPMKNTVIGYDLHPNYWGNGIAKEAVGAILQTAFSGVLPCGAIHRVQADTVPGNIASEHLLLALGFKFEGLRRESGYWKNKFHDLKCFGLLAHEYKQAR